MSDEDEEFTADGEWHWWMSLSIVLVPFYVIYFYSRHWLSGRRWP